jgi:hypothetical protein
VACWRANRKGDASWPQLTTCQRERHRRPSQNCTPSKSLCLALAAARQVPLSGTRSCTPSPSVWHQNCSLQSRCVQVVSEEALLDTDAAAASGSSGGGAKSALVPNWARKTFSKASTEGSRTSSGGGADLAGSPGKGQLVPYKADWWRRSTRRLKTSAPGSPTGAWLHPPPRLSLACTCRVGCGCRAAC